MKPATPLKGNKCLERWKAKGMKAQATKFLALKG